MSYAPRQYEDDIYPDDGYWGTVGDAYPEYPPGFDYEPDPDTLRDIQMEREWVEDSLLSAAEESEARDAGFARIMQQERTQGVWA